MSIRTTSRKNRYIYSAPQVGNSSHKAVKLGMATVQLSIWPSPSLISRCVSNTRRSSVFRKHYSTSPDPFARLPIIQKCPDCNLEGVCSQPEGLDIDHDRSLANTTPFHQRHLLVSTGKNDWSSKIENEPGYGAIARLLKEDLGPKGPYHKVRTEKRRFQYSIQTKHSH